MKGKRSRWRIPTEMEKKKTGDRQRDAVSCANEPMRPDYPGRYLADLALAGRTCGRRRHVPCSPRWASSSASAR